ncbi:MAG: hypothetical protein A4E35_01484 [Methanoregula sp. PtaU1.Bin051]|nr:MAG: hypothetical protein A4E35_01484 [Methanoregula sp. PtaU1.Bin051]
MESLESKLCRLSQDQQREVEDFVDFLLQRQEKKPVPLIAPVKSSEFPVTFVPPPLPVDRPHDETPGAQLSGPAREQDRQPVTVDEYAPDPIIREIGPDQGDALASEYLDYGSFEHSSPAAPPLSPATEAVQRVRVRLSAKKTQDKAGDNLDWID